MHNEVLPELDGFAFNFCFLVRGNAEFCTGGLVMLFSFLTGGVGEVSEDEDVAGLPLKLFLLGLNALCLLGVNASGCKIDCFREPDFLPCFCSCS